MDYSKDVFVTDIHDLTGYTKSEVRMFLSALQQVVIKHLRRGESIQLFGGFKIKAKTIPEREKRLPNGSIITIPEHVNVNVKIGKVMKDALK